MTVALALGITKPAAAKGMQDDVLVEFDKVEKRYGTQVVVASLDLTIHKGEFLALMGASGSGKTTTLRMLAGLEQPSAGEIRIGGKRMNELAPSKRDTPMVWQSLALFPFLTVQENVEFGLKMRGDTKTDRRRNASEWLERLEIAAFSNRMPDQLSGGQRQRVALARALVTKPEILLLDEPLSALDSGLAVRMQGELVRLQKELGITFVYVTHSQSEAFGMADRVAIMNNGRIEQLDAPRAIYNAPRNSFVATFLGSNSVFHGTVERKTTDGFELRTPDGTCSVSAIRGEDVTIGETRIFVVPDDQVRCIPENQSGANSFPARVVGEAFSGGVITIHLELHSGALVRAQHSARDNSTAGLQVGDAVYITFPPAAATFLEE